MQNGSAALKASLTLYHNRSNAIMDLLKTCYCNERRRSYAQSPLPISQQF